MNPPEPHAAQRTLRTPRPPARLLADFPGLEPPPGPSTTALADTAADPKKGELMFYEGAIGGAIRPDNVASQATLSSTMCSLTNAG